MLKNIYKIRDNRLVRNGYLLFSPFLIYYFVLIKRKRWPVLFGDEPRYVNYANNLIHGFFSPPAPHINLWSGPGYPMLLMPFAIFNAPIIYMAIFNGVLYYLSVVFLYKALTNVIDYKLALFFSFLWAIYPNMLDIISSLYTETATVFIVTAFIFSLTYFYKYKNNRYLIVSGLLLGYLALIKIIFGYVLMLALVICIILFFIKKVKYYYLKSIYILLIAFIVTIPYLAYTYHITGKLFYWGNSGGMSLYWMTTNYDQEYGDWKSSDLRNSQYPVQYQSAEGDSILKFNHKKDIALIQQYNELSQDSLYKKMAITNIRQHPTKFIKNCFYNISRLLFNFPYSYTYEDSGTIRNIVTGSIMLWLSLIAVVLSIINWKELIYPIKFTLLITFIYLILTTVLSAYPRQLDVVLPVLFFWVAFITSNLAMPKIRFSRKVF